jgi:hypothetical protein
MPANCLSQPLLFPDPVDCKHWEDSWGETGFGGVTTWFKPLLSVHDMDKVAKVRQCFVPCRGPKRQRSRPRSTLGHSHAKLR